MLAFLLKTRVNAFDPTTAYQTIGGFTTRADTIVDGVRTILARGIFTGHVAERSARMTAQLAEFEPFELSFENGERWRGEFRLAKLDYVGDYNGERTYDITLVSRGALVEVSPRDR